MIRRTMTHLLILALYLLMPHITKAQDRALAGDPWAYFEGLTYDPSVPAPQDILGYAIGERFSLHADVVRYCRAVADASERVQFRSYGTTHEGRSLQILTVSSPDNLARLDEILALNRALTDPETPAQRAREIIESNPAIVWLSYNVHGNEASSSEAAMRVLYTLAAGRAKPIDEILQACVIVIDPMLNPDGRDRYVSWYRSVVGVRPNPAHDASEHHEPWPGGRTNHYLFDLNRDWVWLVHPESRSRLRVYREYLPQLHIDYHEQGYRSPYFFGLGDDPYNANIPWETRQWVELYGRHNAEVFDREGLVYATKERFDYLYPGYGKVLPVYHGAVGMLCEQAGHGFAGRSVRIHDHYDLTLLERARHHFLTSMSYLETTAAHREGQLERFRNFYSGTIELARQSPMTFFIMGDNDPDLLAKVFDLAQAHGITIERLVEPVLVEDLHSYRSGEAQSTILPAGTWVVRTDQAMGRLVRALFERHSEVSDPDTYDITAWSLPVSFGLDAAYSLRPLEMELEAIDAFEHRGEVVGEGDVALLIDASQAVLPAIIGLASEMGMFCRIAGDEIAIAGERFAHGTLIVHTLRNQHVDLDAFVRRATDMGARIVRTDTGMTDEGPVLGANANRIMDLPRIALVRGEPASAYSFGQHWHMLDIARPMAHTVVDAQRLGRADLDAFNVIVLPDGARLSDAQASVLDAWVRAGGTLVASGSAAVWAGSALLDLKPEEDPDDRPEPSRLTREQRDERAVEDRVPGAMVRIEVDTSHPLSAGCRDWLGVIKRNMTRLPVRDDGEVIARYEGLVGGVISERNLERLRDSAFMTRHRHGDGSVICLGDDVTIRGFLHGPMRLLLNAICYGPSL